MTKFKVIDITTGKEVSSEKIDKIAKENGLMYMDIDQFFIGEDGQLILADDCGKFTYCDMKKLGFMPISEGKYPDLEYFETVLLSNVHHSHPDVFHNPHSPHIVELVAMFPQTWSNTAGGFSEPDSFSGQAMTTELTTVMQLYVPELNDTFYGVFFGNRPAYIVEKANAVFFDDLKNHNMKSRHEAKKVY